MLVFPHPARRFDLASFIDQCTQDSWAMNQHRGIVSPGDRVFFWETGPDARLLAVGHVTSPVYQRESSFGQYGVDVSFDYKVTPPLSRQEIAKDILGNFPPFKGKQGTNFPMQDPAIIAALENKLEGRLFPLSGSKTSQLGIEDSHTALDAAIKRAKHDTTNRMREFISKMDPAAFEWLIRALLLKLGYKHVEVTKQSGDGGIDVRATLVAGGIANMQTCIQVKRMKSVGRPVVQSLRGSLSSHEAGLLMTSGLFTEGAVEESKDPHKISIALIDGPKLVELLLDHEIGVEHVNVTLYRLSLNDLSKEQLESLVEESDEGDAEARPIARD
jgi:HJR/Mrr/RecB family endonuclease